MNATPMPPIATAPAVNWRAVLRSRSFLAAVAVLLVVAAVWTATLVAQAQPRTLDQRVYDVASQLQCPICQGESAADSPSTLAQQMRAVIRERLQQGQSEQQVMQYFVSTYGEGIRESPPMSGFTLIMWLGPVLMLVVGIWLVMSVARQWRAAPALAGGDDAELESLSPEDEARYRALLDTELETGLSPSPSPTERGASGSPFSRREGGRGVRSERSID